MTAILGLLSGRQSYFVDKMSQMIIRESSNLEETSDDKDLSDWEREDMRHMQHMFTSSNKVDQRFIDLYRVRKAHQLRVKIGFQTTDPDEVLNGKRTMSYVAEVPEEDHLVEQVYRINQISMLKSDQSKKIEDEKAIAPT